MLATATPALAAEKPYGLELGVASQYVGKGLDKSDGRAAVSGTFRIQGGPFYASAFASSAHLKQGGDSEVILTVGAKHDVAGFDVDVQLMDRSLPGTRHGYDAEYLEYQADVSKTLGSLSARLRLNYSPNGYGPTRAAWWNEAQLTWKADRKTKVSAAVAIRRAQGGADYNAWNVGVKRKLTDRLSGDLRWYDTDQHRLGDAYKGRAVASLTFAL